MGLRVNDTYAKLWAVENKGKYSVVELSVSRKNKDTGEYETDFSDKFARFVGEAHTALQGMTGKERIKITSGDISNRYDKEKKVTYTNFVVFSFEKLDGENEKPKADTEFMQVDDADGDEIPFN